MRPNYKMNAFATTAVALGLSAMASPVSSYGLAFPYDDGFYEMRTANNLCIDVSGWSIGNGARVIQWPCHGGANQLWRPEYLRRSYRPGDNEKVTPYPGGSDAGGANDYQFRNRNSWKCLDVTGYGTFLGAKTIQWTCSKPAGSYPWDPFAFNPAQAWELTSRWGYDYLWFTLQSALTYYGDFWYNGLYFRCLDVPSNTGNWNVQLQLWNCAVNDPQSFYLYGFRR